MQQYNIWRQEHFASSEYLQVTQAPYLVSVGPLCEKKNNEMLKYVWLAMSKLSIIPYTQSHLEL